MKRLTTVIELKVLTDFEIFKIKLDLYTDNRLVMMEVKRRHHSFQKFADRTNSV